MRYAMILLIVAMASTASADYFIHITDIHVDERWGNKCWTTFVDAVDDMEPPPAFIVATGDLVQCPRPENWAILTEPLTTINGNHYIGDIPIYFCPGNHDLPDYEQVIGDLMYSTSVGPLRLISLCSGSSWNLINPDTIIPGELFLPEGTGLTPKDIAFLRSALNDNSQAMIIMHHPFVNPASPYGLLDGTFVNGREEFLRECVHNEVPLVLAGHIHEWVYRAAGWGVWNKDGGAWQEGDGTRFVVTGALKNWCYRRIYLTGAGQIASVGPIESLIPPTVDVRHNEPFVEYSPPQNYPNPFNPVTTITYTLPEQARVTVDIYNVLGQRVGRLVDESQSAGKHSVIWNGEPAPTGLYFYRIVAGDKIDHGKMLLLK